MPVYIHRSYLLSLPPQDNHNVYVKASSIGSSNSSNNNNNTSDKHSGNTNVYGGNFNVVKVTKNKIRSISSKK